MFMELNIVAFWKLLLHLYCTIVHFPTERVVSYLLHNIIFNQTYSSYKHRTTHSIFDYSREANTHQDRSSSRHWYHIVLIFLSVRTCQQCYIVLHWWNIFLSVWWLKMIESAVGWPIRDHWATKKGKKNCFGHSERDDRERYGSEWSSERTGKGTSAFVENVFVIERAISLEFFVGSLSVNEESRFS